MLESIFENVGRKIKTLVKVIFVIEVIGAVCTGIGLMAADILPLLGFAIICIGPFVAWISCWFLYGFGEIVDRCCRIDENLEAEKYSNKAANYAVEVNELPDL